jgi:hypothetical protein
MEINLLKLPAVYVNLDHDVDRKEQTEKELIRWGHLNFSRINAHAKKQGEWPWAGQNRSYTDAAMSHKAPLIVFEDDIVLNSNHSMTEIEVPEDADAVYLGGLLAAWPNGKRAVINKTNIESIVGVKDLMSNHAILFLSQNLVNEYVGLLSEEKRADVMMSELSHKYNFYAVQPVLFYQNDTREGFEVHNSFTRITNYLTGEMFDAPKNNYI